MSARPPNAPRVSGAGPSRKLSFHPKTCQAPHPLQPIVRPRWGSETRRPQLHTGTNGSALPW
jgi:hypothetical protein